MVKQIDNSHMTECPRINMHRIPPGQVMLLVRGSAFNHLKVWENDNGTVKRIINKPSGKLIGPKYTRPRVKQVNPQAPQKRTSARIKNKK